MKYTLFGNKQGKGGWKKSEMFCISKSAFTFSVHFTSKYEVKDYILFYSDEDGFLCFKFCDEPEYGTYKITHTKANAHFLRLPNFFRENERAPKGKYNVVERDGYYVSNCKLKLDEEK